MYCIRSLLYGSLAGAMHSHYNDVRTPAVWTGVIKNEDLNALARMLDLAALAAVSQQKDRRAGNRTAMANVRI
jgi:hypothetical protein